ncbi:hypothetical protein NCC49_004322 [Naganishia albida]|nr:hypothetical protein NCC49_004322 [Naganishia albida]
MPPVNQLRRMHYEDEERSQVIPSDVADTVNEIRDGLNVLLEDSIRRVKGTADAIENNYIAPIGRSVGKFASGSPVVFTFLLFFGFFSAIPVFIAIGILTFATSVLLTAVLGFFAFAVTVMLLIAGAILTPILIFTSFVSFIATSSLVCAFLATRLYLCISKRGLSDFPAGVLDWMEETRLRVLLTLGLGEKFETSDAKDKVEPETILLTRIVVPSTIPEDDEREEDDKTEVGYRESPERVKLEVIEIVSAEPLSAVGIVPKAGDEDVKPESQSFGSQGEGLTQGTQHTLSHRGHKDEETAVAEEAGV